MNIRLSSLDDISAIIAIEQATNETPWTKEQFISSMEVGNYSNVMELKRAVFGFSIFSLIVPEAHLLNIALLHEHQGKGLGRNLLEHTAFQSKTLGAKILFLEVRVSNKKAIRLYESMGFVKDAIRANYYSGKLKEDALLMSLKL